MFDFLPELIFFYLTFIMIGSHEKSFEYELR